MFGDELHERCDFVWEGRMFHRIKNTHIHEETIIKNYVIYTSLSLSRYNICLRSSSSVSLPGSIVSADEVSKGIVLHMSYIFFRFCTFFSFLYIFFVFVLCFCKKKFFFRFCKKKFFFRFCKFFSFCKKFSFCKFYFSYNMSDVKLTFVSSFL